MKSIAQPLPGVHLLEPKVFTDARGDFVKTYHAGIFADLGIQFTPVEEFYSTSRKGVLRGMHFQVPPYDHDKLVYCVRGRVLDVLLDLRLGSPTYGRSVSAELAESNRYLFFIPKGIAHGFLSLEESSTMVYKTTTVHEPSADAGVHWNGFGFEWGTISPNVSDRDNRFPSLTNFVSPFCIV